MQKKIDGVENLQTLIEKELPLVPELPQEVIDAYSQKRLAVFIGAGISRLVGCWGWDYMADKLIQTVCTPKRSSQILRGNLNSKEKITISKKSQKKKIKRKSSGKYFVKQ